MPILRHTRKINRCLWPVMAWGFLLPSIGYGETLGEVVNPKAARNEWVSDMAGVLDHETKHRLNALIDQMEQKTTAEMAVVTIRLTDGRSPKEFATELFNRWGIGKKGKDNGVLVLLVIEARRIEVETGYGVEGILPDAKVARILDTQAIPRFKQGDFSGGLLAGIQALVDVISTSEITPPTVGSRSPTSSIPTRTPTAVGSPPYTLYFWLFLSALLMSNAYFAVQWVRKRFRSCPQCGKHMRRLTEDQDDAYLSLAQGFEEKLGSVDYHVWRCDDCRLCQVESGQRWLRGYEDCPKCGNCTVREKLATLIEPTYERNGEGKVTRTCRFPKCTYFSTEHYSIPPVSRSSNGWSSGGGGGWGGGGGGSSGGSFGGGSSGGGGAGRSW